MNLLETPLIRLRALEAEDVDVLYLWENDTGVWGVSNTLLPFSRNTLRAFIDSQSRDIYETRQTRFIIESRAAAPQPVGALDLFDFDPRNMRAAIGILVHDDNDRGRGYATDAVAAITAYSREILGLHQIYCNIALDNAPSIALFEKCGFSLCGTKKEWQKTPDGWTDELVYQKILRNLIR